MRPWPLRAQPASPSIAIATTASPTASSTSSPGGPWDSVSPKGDFKLNWVMNPPANDDYDHAPLITERRRHHRQRRLALEGVLQVDKGRDRAGVQTLAAGQVERDEVPEEDEVEQLSQVPLPLGPHFDDVGDDLPHD